MSIWSNPPTATKGSFRKGDVHLGVFSIQSALNVIQTGSLIEDGAFGKLTEAAAERYQEAVGVTADGVVGPVTQGKLAHSCIIRSTYGPLLPKQLLEGLVSAESGDVRDPTVAFIAAVNNKVAGGIDYGFTQRRCYGPPFDVAKVRVAADPTFQVNLAARELKSNHDDFIQGVALSCPFNAWELAVLHHNWPYAAEQFHDHGGLPDPGRVATWVTWTRMTWDQWAHYYVAQVTKNVKW